MAVRKEEVRVTADVSNFTTKMAAAGAAASGFAKRLDEADGRMSNLVQTGLALAPALVPLGAAAVPAIAGLANQLGVAALAAGATVLAFKGVGDAVKALDAYKLAPTAENFAKLQQAMDKLGPAGQQFALFVDGLQPKLRALQAVAEQGLLPGVEDGLRNLIPLLPEAQRLIFAVSSTLGDLVSEGTRSLSDSSWTSFFDYLSADAASTLQDMGATVGSLASAFRDLFQAFDPLSRSFSSGMRDMAASFADWAAGLAQTQGFQDFLGYIDSSGPKALAALGAIGNALVQIVEAAAPVGAIALPAITGIANAISALADSSVGPVLITTAAAIGVLGRSLSLLQTVGLRGGKGGFLYKNYVAPSKDAIAALRGQEVAVKGLTTAEDARSAAIGRGAAAFGKAAAAGAGLAIATSGLADNFGLSNTASLALMGTLAGPWGAAVGGAVGLVKDLAAANNDLESAAKAANNALSGNPLDIAGLSAKVEALRSSAKAFTSTDIGSIGDAVNLGVRGLDEFFTHAGSEAQDSLRKTSAQMSFLSDNLKTLSFRMNGNDFSKFNISLAEQQQLAQRLAPALQRAGISADSFSKGLLNVDQMRAVQQAWHDYIGEMDSAVGKSGAVGKALADLSTDMADNVTQANALKSAMDSLFGIQLSQSAATDAWTQNLRDLAKEIGKTNGAILGTSNAALSNRAAIRGSVQALQDKINADAAAGESGDKLVGSLLKGRDAIIRQATAAGASRKAVRSYLDTLNLTPKNLATIIQQPGMLTAKQQVQALGKLYGLTPKQVQTLISQPGMGKSKADIDALAKKYNLTPKQVSTLLTAVDHASSVINGALIRLREFDGRTATSYLRTVTTHQVVTIPGIVKPRGNQANGGLWDGRTQTFADGGWTDSGAYVPRVPQMRKGGGNILWSEPETGWEAYISGKPGMRERNLSILSQAADRLGADVSRRYADGGIHDTSTAAERKREAKELKAVSKELSKLTQALKDTRSNRNQYRSQVSQAFVSDPFGGTLGGFDSQVAYESRRLRGAKADLRTLDKHGIGQGLFQALAASGNASLIDQFAHLSKSQLAARSTAFRTRNALDRGIGTLAANDVYGSRLRDLGTSINFLTREMKALQHGKHIGNQIVNFNGSVSARDVEALAKKIRHRTQTAARVARHK